jgi:very-short-patch-repair endonuclease
MRNLDGVKFRRQFPIGPFVADFACLEHRLVIEVDGGQHASRTQADEFRTARLEEEGWRVLRFWNNEVLENTEGVMERIAMELRACVRPHPYPPPQAGEGG